MLELLNLDLCLLQFCPGMLILLSLAPPVFQSTFAAFYVLERPAASLLIADIVRDCNLSIVLTVGLVAKSVPES